MCTVLLFLVVLLNLTRGENSYISDQDQYEKLGFTGPKPCFQQPVYVAFVSNNEAGDFLYLQDGPIILKDCASLDTSFEIILDESKYSAVPDPLPSYISEEKCKMLPIIFLKPGSPKRFQSSDFIFLKAIHKEHTVAMTTIIVMDEEDSDTSGQIFDVGGTTYVVLNYLRFKVFLVCVFSIGVLILGLEIRDLIVRNFNIFLFFFKDESKYSPVPDPMPSYISEEKCKMLPIIFIKPGSPKRFQSSDFIFLKAIHKEHTVAMTTIVVMDKKGSDTSGQFFDVDGTTYVVLNYLRFKMFLVCVFSIGVLILGLEIRDQIVRYRNRNEYRLLTSTINYI
ncbi:hypothetical protein JTB14_034192 [Gonioctena quinquepunctata]|nr:hypothetical protein JTB14_034192 [Gonioctena quinquepunctata]